MVTNDTRWEEYTRKLYDEARTELVENEKQIKSLQERAVELAREVTSYQYALEGYLKRVGKSDNLLLQSQWLEHLKNLPSHRERIQAIVKRFGGVSKVKKVTDVLYPNFIKSKSWHNAYSIVYGLFLEMTEDGIFKKVGPAEYQLLSGQPSLSEKIF